jgi:predicted membrane-bound spermidine synthase
MPDPLATEALAGPPVIAALEGDAPLRRSRSLVLVVTFSVAIFLNATLLFAVQPLFTKMVLPLLGGSPAIWNTCLLFFQAALLGGYLYAHATSRWLSVRVQAAVHLALLVVAVVFLPIHIPEAWAHPPGTALPIPWLLGLLSVSLGLPFFLLAAGAPMMQRWFAETKHESAHNPYFLYAASNLGSFAALLAYPFLIEPRLRISEQAVTWLGVYYVLLALIMICAIGAIVWKRRVRDAAVAAEAPAPVTPSQQPAGTMPEPARARRPGALRGTMRYVGEYEDTLLERFLGGPDRVITEPTLVPNAHWRLRWVLLSFAPSSLLIGVTTYLSTDIASVPFLWVLPLALYLLTFVLVFARRPPIPRWPMLHVQLVLALVLMVSIVLGTGRGIAAPFTLHLLAFFATAMMCHRELADSRPRAEYLTEFYLWMSFGGVLGGVFNVILAPLLYDSLIEYPFALVIALGLRPGMGTRFGDWRDLLRDVTLPMAVGVAIWFAYRLPMSPDEWFQGGSFFFLAIVAMYVMTFWPRPFRLALGAGAIYVAMQVTDVMRSNVLLQERSFFGIYRVRRIAEYNVLQNGTTTHGGQSRQLERRLEPLTYYSTEGPLGDLFNHVAQHDDRRVAMVGLGTGTIACFGRPGEHWTFYEIDPMVLRIASTPRLFTYLRDCPPRTNTIIGDARLSLQAAADGEFDVIVLDAFTSDAIPAHLITKEALALYLRKLKEDGVVAFHISNRYLDLRPVLMALAHDANAAGALGERGFDDSGRLKLYYGSRWIVLAKLPDVLRELAQLDGWHMLGPWEEARLWTDDYTDVLGALKW